MSDFGAALSALNIITFLAFIMLQSCSVLLIFEKIKLGSLTEAVIASTHKAAHLKVCQHMTIFTGNVATVKAG